MCLERGGLKTMMLSRFAVRDGVRYLLKIPVWYRQTSSRLSLIVRWGSAVTAVLLFMFPVWAWFATDVMHWPIMSVFAWFGFLVVLTTVVFFVHVKGKQHRSRGP
jgi:hypothetical protein